MGDWAVVIAKPMAEEVAERNLKSGGWVAYLPRYRKILRGHRRGARGEIVMRPLFPRYLFAEIWPEQQWWGILRTTGVQDIVWWGERPATVSHETIDLIRDEERQGTWDDPRSQEKKIRRSEFRDGKLHIKDGDEVRIIEGQFAGFVARLVDIDEQQRAYVMLDYLGALRRTRVPLAAVEKVAI